MAPKLPLPRGWKRRVRSSGLRILALGHYHLLEQRTFARRTWTSTPLGPTTALEFKAEAGDRVSYDQALLLSRNQLDVHEGDAEVDEQRVAR